MPKILSDAEMAELESKSSPKRVLTDDEMLQLEQQSTVQPEVDPELAAANAIKKGIDTLLIKPAAWAGRQVDRFTGAPARAAIGALQEGESPISAGISQLSKDPEVAPTGKEIAARAGLSTKESIPFPWMNVDGSMAKVSPAGIAGTVVDMAADPTNLIPGSLFAKGAAKAGVETAAIVGKTAAKATDIATGLEVGAKATAVAKRAKDAVKLAKSKLFSPKQAEDFAEMLSIAERNGIPREMLPAAVEFGPDSIITRMSRVKAEGPIGQAELEKFRTGQEAVQQATAKRIETIAGGVVPNRQEAGSVLRDGYAQKLRETMAGAEDTYAQIGERFPNLLVDEGARDRLGKFLDNLESKADDRLRAGVTSQQKAQALELKEAIEVARANAWTFDELQKVLRNVGDAAYSKDTLLLNPPDRQALRDIYGQLRETLTESVRKGVGPEVADRLVENNKRIAKFLDDRNPLEKALGNPVLSDEQLFASLVENGDSRKIAALKEILPPEQLQQVKGAFLDSLLRKDFEDGFSYRGLKNRMKAKELVLENLLEPEEFVEFADLVRLGDRFGVPVMSTSGTGASNMLKDIKNSAIDAVVNDAFIEELKAAARNQGAPSIQDALSKIRLDPKNPGHWNQLNSSVQGSRMGLDRASKRAQMISVAPFEVNDKRREEMRAAADAEVIASVPPAALLQAMGPLGTPADLRGSLTKALESGGVFGLRETVMQARASRAVDIERLAKAADLLLKKPEGKKFLTPDEVENLDAIRIFDPVQIQQERNRIMNDTSIPSTERASQVSRINERGYLQFDAPPQPTQVSEPVDRAPTGPTGVGGLMDMLSRAVQ